MQLLVALLVLALRGLGVAIWLGGAVLAHGFWSTLFALIFPPWGLYLIVERLMHAAGWV